MSHIGKNVSHKNVSLKDDFDSVAFEDVSVLDAVTDRLPALLDAQPEILQVWRQPLPKKAASCFRCYMKVLGRASSLRGLGTVSKEIHVFTSRSRKE